MRGLQYGVLFIILIFSFHTQQTSAQPCRILGTCDHPLSDTLSLPDEIWEGMVEGYISSLGNTVFVPFQPYNEFVSDSLNQIIISSLSDTLGVGYPAGPIFGGQVCGAGPFGYIVPDKWGIPGVVEVDFTPACQRHDTCYEVDRPGQKECDDEFRDLLVSQCNNDLNGVSEVLLPPCLVVAQAYYEAVRSVGGEWYDKHSDGASFVVDAHIFGSDDWFGDSSAGAGAAGWDIDQNGREELFIFHIDNPDGGNLGYYRIASNLDAGAVPSLGWSDPIAIPGWWGNDNAGGGITAVDVDGTGQPELFVFHIDNPDDPNVGYYRIGSNVGGNGIVSGWSDPIAIPGWWGNDNFGGGIAHGYIDINDEPDLIVYHIDYPQGANSGWYRIGWNIQGNGIVSSWSDPIAMPGWFGNETSGAGVTSLGLDNDDASDVVFFHIDNPAGPNAGYYRVQHNLR